MSQKRTGTSLATAHRIACHSGENSANGQKVAGGRSVPSPARYASSATGGRMSGEPASGTSGSASGGPSIRTTCGRYASRTRLTARADPGPWWRTPSRTGIFGMPSGPVEFAPAVAFAHDGLQILLPHDGVRGGVLHHSAHDPRRHVGRAQHTVAEVCGERDSTGDYRDGLSGRQGAGWGFEPGAAVLG